MVKPWIPSVIGRFRLSGRKTCEVEGRAGAVSESIDERERTADRDLGRPAARPGDSAAPGAADGYAPEASTPSGGAGYQASAADPEPAGPAGRVSDPGSDPRSNPLPTNALPDPLSDPLTGSLPEPATSGVYQAPQYDYGSTESAGFPAADSGSAAYPASDYSTGSYPTPDYPAADYPATDYSASDYTATDYSAASYTPQPGSADLFDFPPLPAFPEDPAAESTAQAPQGATTPDPLTGPPPGPTGAPGPTGGVPQQQGRLRIATDAEATARLRIKLPDSPPVPAAALRSRAAWEDVSKEDDPSATSQSQAAPFAQAVASPARPSTLPSELAALTTATLVVPIPPDVRPTPALLTRTLPPDKASLANAALLEDAFHDTLEQVFGIDFGTATPADVGLGVPDAEQTAVLDAVTGLETGAAASPAETGLLDNWFRDEAAAAGRTAEPGGDLDESGLDQAAFDSAGYDYVPDYVPGAVSPAVFGGPYGVPTHPAPFPGFAVPDTAGHDPARHALALRYLGGIFHDSSGHSSYLDPERLALSAGPEPAALTAPPAPVAPEAPTEMISRIPRQAASPTAPTTSTAPSRRAGSRLGAARSDEPREGKTATPAAPKPSAGTGPSGRATTRPERHGSAARPERRESTAGSAASAGNEAKPKGRSRKRTVTAVVCVIAVFAAFYGLALVTAGGVVGGTVPRGSVVDGVSIGGMSTTAAEHTLADGLAQRVDAPIDLLVGATPTTLDPQQAGLSLDAAATVARAESHRIDPMVVIPAMFGAAYQVTPAVGVDQAALTRALTAISNAYTQPMTEGKITFNGTTPVVTAPQAGRGFSIPGAAAAIESGYLQVDGPIMLPVEVQQPLATPAALQAALTAIARPAVAAPITLTTGSVTTVLTPAQIGAALTVAPNSSGQMVPQINGTALRADLPAAALAQETPAVDATFTISGSTPQLIPGRDGRGFSPDALAQAVSGVLTKQAPRAATVPIGDLPPTFTTAQAQALGVTDVLGTSTLAVPTAANRAANVERATTLVAGNVVQPGQTFSFLSALGPLTTANGFALSSQAQQAGVDPSDGVDTTATAVFDAAFNAGMGDTIHHPNASYVPLFPDGLDAAVVAPGTDLQWTNTATHPVYLYANYSSGSLTVALLGQKYYDQVQVQVSQRYAVVQPTSGCGQPGFQVDVTRTLERGGQQAGVEHYHVQYVPQQGATGSACTGTGGGTPASGGSSADPGSSSGSGSGSGSGGGGGQSAPPSSRPTSPTPPSASQPGLLGGLLG
jgi:vancomycin resistance protein YoaR